MLYRITRRYCDKANFRKLAAIVQNISLISTLGGCIVHRAPSTEFRLVLEVGISHLCNFGVGIFFSTCLLCRKLLKQTREVYLEDVQNFSPQRRRLLTPWWPLTWAACAGNIDWENTLCTKTYRIWVCIIVRALTRHVETTPCPKTWKTMQKIFMATILSDRTH